MKRLCTGGLLLLLAGCGVTRQAEVSSVDVTSGVVMLNYDQAMLQNARYDDYVTSGTATRECQAMGYNTAMAYGQPVKTCSLISGSLCLMAMPPGPSLPPIINSVASDLAGNNMFKHETE